MTGPAEKSDGEQIMDLVKQETGGDGVKNWFEVGMTLAAWEAAAGGCIAHQGTLLWFEDGTVWMAGMIGLIFAGLKMVDGTVNYAPTMMHPDPPPDTAVVAGAADPDYGDGCYRLPSGAIHCECADDY